MSLTVLSVSYPLAPVGPDAVGGAEQILSALDAGLVAAGHRSIVIAPEGSEIAGIQVAIPPVPAHIDDAVRWRAEAAHRRAIREAIARWPVDLIHAHGLDFAEHLPRDGPPALVTLHLPASFYPPAALAEAGPETWFNCVSASQHGTFSTSSKLLEPIPNGVPFNRLQARFARRDFVLVLGRVCPEKGIHLALDAAVLAGVPALVAGRVFPYPAHRQYFDCEIAPRLGPNARFLGGVGFARKRRLLTAARCLLVPSLVPETSSLVAMEALACGTPVVAFPAGALPEIVEHGMTGFLVEDVKGMAAAVARADRIDRERCRDIARRRFSLDAMVRRYFGVYQQLARRSHEAVGASP